MTANELQKLIDYTNSTLTKHSESVYNENTGNFDIYPTAYFNEVLQVLSQYPIEDPKECCKPNYEAMYNELHAAHNDLKKKNKELKDDVSRLEYKLVCAKGAIAMVEVIYGRQWSPAKLELIR